ncbi:MAG TPA: hypothetical protein VFP87_07765 [Chitinophagaceae bacterium]|nr:hypothetical protein [Chitinophagaceae bacterium]
MNGYHADTGPKPIDANIAAPAYGGIANELYHIGTKTLRIDITPDTNADLFACYNDLTVVPESVGGSWWQWDTPITTPDPSATLPPALPLVSQDFSSIINHAYTLSGKMTNSGRSPNNTMTGSLTLYETEFGKQSVPLEAKTFVIEPGAQQAIVFSPITKNWGWIIPGVWAENQSEPRSKRFGYEVVFTMSDSYGNYYSDARSFKVNIDVSVSSEKRAYGNGALGVLGVGIIAAIFTFGAGLSAATAIAAGLGRKAQDPPEPDGLYNIEVPVQLIDILPKEKMVTPFVELGNLLNSMYHTLIIMDALAITHNRILGALIAKNQKALKRQRTIYSKTERMLQSYVKRVSESAHATLFSLKSNKNFRQNSIREKLLLLQFQGMSSEAGKTLTENGYPQQDLLKFIDNINTPEMVEFAQSINQIFTLLALSFGMIGREIARQKENLLKQTLP